jgi:glycosyltransferase involved in cell wall biosynthesis
MRVLILHSRYSSGPASGENRVVDDEARLLTEAGHHVELFAPDLGRPAGLDLISAGLGTIWSRQAGEHVVKLIEQSTPDLVHCHNLFPSLSPSVIRASTEDIPVVMTLHNYRLRCLSATLFRDGRVCEDCLGRTPWPGIVHRCYQESLAASVALASSLVLHRVIGSFGRVRLFIAISEFVREKHIEGGISPSQIIAKPHFVWPVQRRESPGEYFLYLGRLAPEKGVDFLLGAWKHVAAKLLIAGDGPDSTRLRGIAPANVEFRGTIEPDEVPRLLRGARALLVPSTWYEGAGRVVLEAYAAGVPVLATRVGALPEVVRDGITGLLLPTNDTRAWVEATERIGDDTESKRMGEAGWELWRERYSPETGLENLQRAYRRALT